MIEAEVCRYVFDFVFARKKQVPSEDIFDELSFFEKKTVQSAMHALMKAGVLDREPKVEGGFLYSIPKGISKREMESVFATGTDFADITALSPVPEEKRKKAKTHSPEDIKKAAIDRAKSKGDSVLDSLERIAKSSRVAVNEYSGEDAFVKSILEEAARRSEDALSNYCDKLR